MRKGPRLADSCPLAGTEHSVVFLPLDGTSYSF